MSAAHYRPELLRVESRHARHRGSRQEFARGFDRGAIRLGRLWFLTIGYPGRSRLPAEVGMYRLAPECRVNYHEPFPAD